MAFILIKMESKKWFWLQNYISGVGYQPSGSNVPETNQKAANRCLQSLEQKPSYWI